MPTLKGLPTLEELKANCHIINGHWLWTKSLAGEYPNIRRGGVLYKCHKLAYERRNGPIPPGMILRHICDIKRCINPDHLIVGTKSENVLDYYRREQPAKGGIYFNGFNYYARIALEGIRYKKSFPTKALAEQWLQTFKEDQNGKCA